MAQQFQVKLQNEVDEVVDDLENKYLRPIRKQAFLDMAKCCDSSSTRETYQMCVQRASVPEERANRIVQLELSDFQSRLQRAAIACSDEVKDSGLKDREKAAAAMEKCLVGVFQKHIKLVPTLKKRIEQSL